MSDLTVSLESLKHMSKSLENQFLFVQYKLRIYLTYKRENPLHNKHPIRLSA